MPEDKEDGLLDINFNVDVKEPSISTSNQDENGLLDINFDVESKEEVQAPKKVSPLENGEGLVEPSLQSESQQEVTGLDSPLNDADEDEYLRALQTMMDKEGKLPSDVIKDKGADFTESVVDKEMLIEAYNKNYEESKTRAITQKVSGHLSSFQDDLPNYIKTNKNRLAKELDEDSSVREEYGFEKKITEISSPENIKSSILTTGIDNNIKVKIQSLKTPEEKETYKRDLINQIKDDSKYIGRGLSKGDERFLGHQSIEDLALEASGLKKVTEELFVVQGDRKKFLSKKFGKIDQENDMFRESLLLEGEDKLTPEKKEYVRSLIKKNEFLKENFIKPDGKKFASQLISGSKNTPTLFKNIIDQLPKDLSDKEKFDMFYLALEGAASESASEAGIGQEFGVARTFNLVMKEALGLEEVPLLGAPLPEGLLSLTKTEKDAYELAGMVNDLKPIFFNNSMYKGDDGDQGFFTDLMNGISGNASNLKRSFMSSIIPKASKLEGEVSDSKKREDLLVTLGETGITESANINKEQLNSYVDNVLSPEGVTTEKVVETLGTSLAFAAEMLVGSGELKAVKALSKGSKAASYAGKLEKVLKKTKTGSVFLKASKSGLIADLSAQGRTGKEQLKDELEFKQMFIGTVAQEAIEGLLKKGVALKFAYNLYNKLGIGAKVASEFTGKLFTSAAGEMTQESFEQIVQAYNQTEDGSDFSDNLNKMFPDMDAISEFLVLTAIMGGGMKIGSSYNDISTKLKEGGYDTSKAEEILGEMNSDMSEAVKEASQETSTETKTDTPKTEKPTAETVKTEEKVKDKVKSFSKQDAKTETAGETKTESDSDFNDKIRKARGGDKEVQAELEEYGMDYSEKPVFRFVSEKEVDAIENGESIKGKNEGFGVDVTSSSDATTASDADYRVSFKEELDYNLEGRAKLKNESSGDGFIEGGYNKSDVSKIEKKGKDGTYTTVYDAAKTESKTAREAKAENKTETVQAEEVTKPTELTAENKAEIRNNTLVDNVKSYNKLSNKSSKSAKESFAKIQRMSTDQSRSLEIGQDGKVDVKDSSGKSIKTTSEFKVKVEAAETSTQDKAWAINEINDGVLDEVDVQTERIQLPGLTYTDTIAGAKQIKKGNLKSPTAKKVLAAMAEARKSGEYLFDKGSGKNIVSTRVPIDTSRRTQTEEEVLSEEDIDTLYGEKATEQDLAKQVEAAKISLADKIRKLKIKKPGSLSSSLGPDIIWDGAVEVLAKSIEGGASVAKAIAKAINHIKSTDWYKKQLPDKRKQVIKDVEASLNDVTSGLESEAKEEAGEKAKEEKRKEIADLEKKRKAEAPKKGSEVQNKEEAGETEESDKEKKVRQAKESISKGDPKRKQKISKHLKNILDNALLTEEAKEHIKNLIDGKYEPTTNDKDIRLATETVKQFAEAGMLEELIEDVSDDFMTWGPVGNFVLEASMLYYDSIGDQSNISQIANLKIRLASKIGQILQSFGANISSDQVASLLNTSMTIAINAEKDIKNDRDEKLSGKANKKDKNGKTKKEQIVESVTSLQDAINVIAEGLASNDPKVKEAIERIVGKVKTTKTTKPTKTAEHNETLRKERENRKKIIADAKKNKGKHFYSSFGITPEGIEMVGDLAASYVRSGITNMKILAEKLRQILKEDFDVEISDADLDKAFSKKNISSLAKSEAEIAASQKLAKKVASEVRSKGVKTEKAIDVLIRNLFSKAKESLPEKSKNETAQSYREKLIEAMSSQDFSKKVWEESKTTIKNILESQESAGEMTGAEKAQVLKDLDLFFSDKVGAPFSKSLLDNSIKEQIKSDGDKINQIIKEHWTNKEERGRTLAEKIVADTDLTPEKATELAKIIQDRFSSLIKEQAKRALAKSLGIDPDGDVKAKDDATLQNIIDAINLGALTEDSYLDAFGKRFNFATITKGDVKKMQKFVFDISNLPAKSAALAKTIRDFNTYLDDLKHANAPLAEKIKRYITDVFITNILGTAETAIRGAVGILWTGPISVMTESIKTFMWAMLRNPKLLKTSFNNFYNDKKKNGDVKKNIGLLYWMQSFWDKKRDIKGAMSDIFKEGYATYEAGQENLARGRSEKSILDRLIEKPFSELTKGQSLAKIYEWIPVYFTRALGASDLLYDSAFRPYLATTFAMKKLLIQGEDITKDAEAFWLKVADITSSTEAALDAAKLQAQNELEVLTQKGVSTKHFNLERRVKEIQWEMMDEDVRVAAERKASEGRLGINPEGDLGMASNWLNEKSKGNTTRAIAINMLTAPFRKIPTNAINLALDYTPIGFLRAAFGRGFFVRLDQTKKREKARDRARVGKGFLKPFRKSQQDREYKAEDLINDRTDMLIRASAGTAALFVAASTMLSSLDKDDDDEEATFQIMGGGKEYYSDNLTLGKSETRMHGVKPYHLRFKLPGTNTWGPWIDYTDSPFSVGLTAVGTLSDKLLYEEKESFETSTFQEKMDVITDPELASSAALEGVIAFKEKSYIQAITDVVKWGDISDESGAKGVGIKAYNWLSRPIKGTIYPQLYNNTYKYIEALTGTERKRVTSAKEGIWRNFVDNMASGTPFQPLMLDDYVNNAGEKIYRPSSVIPFSSTVPSVDITGYKNVSDQLMDGRIKLKASAVFPDPLRGVEVAYTDNKRKELSFEDRRKFEKEYRELMGLYTIKHFKYLKGADDQDFVSDLREAKKDIRDKVLSLNPEWTKIE